MKVLFTLRSAACLVFMSFMLSANYTFAADDQNQYFIKIDVTGSRIPVKLIESPIPFDTNYKNFNDTDKATYRSYYDGIASDSEPPFPTDGLGQVAKDVRLAHMKMQKTGNLFVVASVDELGKVGKVSVFESPDERMSQLVSAAIWDEEFQPGRCSGEPCAMEFVLDWRLLSMDGHNSFDSDKKSRNSRSKN